MYTRRAVIHPFRYLFKVCRTTASDFSCVLLVRNLSAATQSSDFLSRWNENYVGRNQYNQVDNCIGIEPKVNPNAINRQISNGGGSAIGRSDFPIRPAVKNAEAHSYDGSVGQQRVLDGMRRLDLTERNGYAQNLEAQPVVFPDGNVVRQKENFNSIVNGSMMERAPVQDNIEVSYGRNSNITYQQHDAGIAYSNAQFSNITYQSSESYNYLQQHSSAFNSDVQPSESSKEAPVGVENLDEFIRDGKLKDAVELLGHLQEECIQVDLPRYMALITACGEKQVLEQAKLVHQHLLQSIPHLEVRTYNRILEMYVKCGSVDDLFRVFDGMETRNLTSWDTMISGLAQIGHGEDSLLLYDEFKQCGLKPDSQMFLGVFSACGVVCDTIEGMLHFESMIKDHGIIPTMDHYTSIVDMLGSAGCLNEALEFIDSMPIEPGIDIWKRLMKLSRIHGDTELGDRCAEIVEVINPSELDANSRSGLIHVDAAEVEREKEKKKMNGETLLDSRRRVHEFRAGDRSQPGHEGLYALLRSMKQQMKEVGYIPDTRCVLHDVDPESKEEALMAHSERLAAAQGLMTSAARAPMRIIKNLRVCGDCHNAFKIISKLVGREIIARDSKRFHHFRDGSCSCKDYW